VNLSRDPTLPPVREAPLKTALDLEPVHADPIFLCSWRSRCEANGAAASSRAGRSSQAKQQRDGAYDVRLRRMECASVRPVTQLSTRAATPDVSTLPAAPSRRRVGDEVDAWMHSRHVRYVAPCLARILHEAVAAPGGGGR